MAQRPDPSTPATFYSSVLGLCDDTAALLSQVSDLQTSLANVQDAINAEAVARQQAVAAEAQARADGDSSVDAARARAITAERTDRVNALNGAADNLSQQIASLSDSLRQALGAETQARSNADQGEQQARIDAIKGLAKSLADAVSSLEGQISAKANLEDLSKAGDDQAKALADAIAAVRAQIAAVRAASDAVAATVAEQRLEFVASPGRPGDAPTRYTFVTSAAVLGGSRDALPFIPPTMLANSDSGTIVRIDGSGIVAGRAACPLEPGRLYRARYVVQRRVNPADPTGDAIVCGVVYLDQSLRVLGGIVPVRSFPALTTAFGRQECEALIARSAGIGEAFVAPPSARFMVPVVAAYGPDALTDVEVLNLEDVTGSFVLAPPPDGLEARVAALVAALAQRVQVLESEAGTPGKLTFGSKGDAAYATIPDSVQVVEILGRRFPGDGGAGLFVRFTGDPAPGAETLNSHGAVFQRVVALPDVAAAVMGAGFEAFMAGLPTEPPPTSGARWNNDGIPTVTP